MKTLVNALFAILALSIAPPASAGLTDDEAWETMNKDLTDQVGRANASCETKIAGSFDRASFAGVALDRAPVRSYTRDSLYALSFLCKGELAKSAVKAKVSRFVVRRSKTGTKVALEGGALVVLVDPERTSITGKSPGSYSWTSAIKEVL